MLEESIIVATLYEELGNWDLVKEKVFGENLFRSRTTASTQKRWQVLKGRVSCLTAAQRRLLAGGDVQAQRWALLLAIVRYHPLIKEFLIEVVRVKYLLFDFYLLDSDFLFFLHEKKKLSPQLERISPATDKKIHRVILRILTEAGLLSEGAPRQILRPFLTDTFVQTVVEDDPGFLAVFLYADADILHAQEQYASHS